MASALRCGRSRDGSPVDRARRPLKGDAHSDPTCGRSSMVAGRPPSHSEAFGMARTWAKRFERFDGVRMAYLCSGNICSASLRPPSDPRGIQRHLWAQDRARGASPSPSRTLGLLGRIGRSCRHEGPPVSSETYRRQLAVRGSRSRRLVGLIEAERLVFSGRAPTSAPASLRPTARTSRFLRGGRPGGPFEAALAASQRKWRFAGLSLLLAEGEGFEPRSRLTRDNGFQDRALFGASVLLKPCKHLRSSNPCASSAGMS
jgi:hypothetical protein